MFLHLSNGTFVELGTVVFEKYLLDRDMRGLKRAEGLVYGCAFGLERIASVVGGLGDVFSLVEIRSLLELIMEGLDPRSGNLFQDRIRDTFRICGSVTSYEKESLFHPLQLH